MANHCFGKRGCIGALKMVVPVGEAGLDGVTGLYSCRRHIPEGYELWDTKPDIASANKNRRLNDPNWD